MSDLQHLQNRHLHLVDVSLGFPSREVPIKDISHILQLETLEERRNVQDIWFLFKILNHRIGCSEQLKMINLWVPTFTELFDWAFEEPFCYISPPDKLRVDVTNEQNVASGKQTFLLNLISSPAALWILRDSFEHSILV